MTITLRLSNILAPDYCCNCQKIGQIICQSCIDDIISEPFTRCLVCLLPTAKSQLCHGCRDLADDAWVVGERSGSLEKLVDDSKFASNRRACQAQAELLGRIVPRLPDETVVVPLPTIVRHIRQRGYGHTELIARLLARQRRYRCSRLLGRRGNSIQHGTDRASRQRQAASAFVLKRRPPVGAPLLLIDDVYTTGASLRAAAKLLRSATVGPIYLAVTTRQLLD